jgi:SAM-dependent methyltransferase
MAAARQDLYRGVKSRIDRRPGARDEYEARIAAMDSILDIGGRNRHSASYRRLRQLSTNPAARIVSTDIVGDYQPDLIDDICDSQLESASFDGVNCAAILEHVEDYRAAIEHIHRILKPGGEAFFYVPFFWGFHDLADHHRFTFAEVDRMLSKFSRRTVMLPDGNGYGGVVWLLLTYFQIAKLPRLWSLLSTLTNAVLAVPLTLSYGWSRLLGTKPRESLGEYLFYYTHLFVNHGFCAWVKK